MNGRLARISTMFAMVLAVAALVFGFSVSPKALAGDDRLNFTGTTLSGASFKGASLQGKPAVVWFWRLECPFCNA